MHANIGGEGYFNGGGVLWWREALMDHWDVLLDGVTFSLLELLCFLDLFSFFFTNPHSR